MMRGYQVQHAALRSRSETEHLAPIPVPQPLRMHSYVFDAEDGDGGAVLTGHGRRLPLGRVGCSILQRMAELFVREPAESGCLSADATEEARFIDLTSCAVFQKGKANTSAMEFHSMEYSRPRSRDTTNVVVPFRTGDGEDTTLFFATVTRLFRVTYHGKIQVSFPSHSSLSSCLAIVTHPAPLLSPCASYSESRL
jgi:hypothetical protein